MIKFVISLKEYSKGAYKFLIINLLTAVIGNALILINPILIGSLIKTLIPGNINISVVLSKLILIAILYSLGAIILWISHIFSNKYSSIVISNLRNEMFKVVSMSKLENIDSMQTGDIMNRFSTDIDLVYDGLSNFFYNLFQGSTTVIISFSLMIYLNIYLTLVVLIIVPVILIYSKLTRSKGSKRFFKLQELSGDLTGSASEFYYNKTLVKSYNYEEEAKNSFDLINQELLDVSTKAYFISSINNPTYRLFNNFSFALLGLVSLLLSINGYLIEVALLTSMIMYAQMFQKPFNEFSVLTANFLAARAGLERIINVMNFSKEDYSIKENKGNNSGDIIFNNVSFSYNEKTELIKNFNLEVKKGQTVAIVGPTGAGKSTIINLLLKFYDVNNGSVNIDGIDLKDYTLETLRLKFGLVLQEPWLFAGSIRKNLKYGNKDISDDLMIEACKKANCHDFIMNLKDGYDTILNDNVNISTGQKQLLTIARALIVDPSIYILDEATSNIDSLMESRIRDTFDSLMKDKTNFIIAHRLKTIINADIIIVMNEGKIIEQGSHDKLMNDQGFYYDLFMSQYSK